VRKGNNNSEQTVRQDSMATRNALITALGVLVGYRTRSGNVWDGA